MEYRKLGTSDLEISAVGFGGWGIAGGSMWGEQDDRDSEKALGAALDCGITFVDTAEAYGDGYSEQLIGRAIGHRRNEFVLATKVSPNNLAVQALRTACETSLKRLKTDRIDLYQIHWPTPPGDRDAVSETLESLRQEGKIRYAGVSNFGPPDLARYPDGLFVSNQVAYSAAFRAIEFELAEASLSRGMSLITYSSLLHGILTGKFAGADEVPAGRARTRHFSEKREQTRHDEPGHEQELFALVATMKAIGQEFGKTVRELAMRWVLGQNGVATLLAGCRTEAHARANAAVMDVTVPEEAIARLTAASEPLKQVMGPNPDMWMTDSRVGRADDS